MRVSSTAIGTACGLLMVLGVAWGPAANGLTIDFDALANGEIVDTQYQASLGVTISGVSLVSGGADLAIIFDSLASGTADPDLEGPPWSGGNLAPSTVLGNLLILPENTIDADHDGLIDDPDDQGARPAGFFTFGFDTPITDFGLDLVDIELSEFVFGKLSFFSEGALVGTIAFENLPLLDPSIAFGDSTANRVTPIAAHDFGADSFDFVIVSMGGSGALDNITFSPVPEPGTLLLLSVGVATLAAAGRRRTRH